MTEAIYLEVSEKTEAAKKAGRRVSVSGMLKFLGVSRSGYLAWLHHVPCLSVIILELSINNKLNNEHEVKKSERGKRGYRMNTMNKQEINEFIEKMEEVGDVWTEEQVNDVYGDSSFEEALADRQSSLDHMSDIISKVIDK